MIKYLLIILIIPLSVFATECKQCKKVIKGGDKFLKVGEDFFCSHECFLKDKPGCEVCKKKSMQMIKFKEKFYCGENCIKTIFPNCSVCKVSVFKKAYFELNDKVFCSKECYHTTIDSCRECGLKKEATSKVAGIVFCGDCATLSRCDSCGLPTKHKKLPDDRLLCKDCDENKIIDSVKAKQIYDEVKSLMEEKFQMNFSAELTFKIVTLNELKVLRGGYSGNERGFYHVESSKITKTTDGIKRVNRKVNSRSIFVLDHLHEKVFRKVCAHELTHDWQSINYEIDELQIEEGLAEYFSALVCDHYKYDYLKEIIEKNPDEIYGGGYRKIKELQKENGYNDIVIWLIKNYVKEVK